MIILLGPVSHGGDSEAVKGSGEFWHQCTVVCNRLLRGMPTQCSERVRRQGRGTWTVKETDPCVKISRPLVFHQREKARLMELYNPKSSVKFWRRKKSASKRAHPSHDKGQNSRWMGDNCSVERATEAC